MSNLFSGINARFRGPSNKSSGSKSSAAASPADEAPSAHFDAHGASSSGHPAAGKPALVAGGVATAPSGLYHHPSAGTGVGAPKVPPLPNSPSLSQSIGMATSTPGQAVQPPPPPQPLPMWLNPAYAKHIVKGNFMTLSAKPKTVEQGEWIAHHVVEHYRLLWNFVRVVHEKEDDGSSICNPTMCPRMSAGRNHSYTWLNSRLEPIELPAYEYMSLMQRWISGKISDAAILPTDPAGVSFAPDPANPHSVSASNALLATAAGSSGDGTDDWVGRRSGFPREFFSVCKTIFLQMFRVYAHLYWNHFVDFYHLNLEKQLNSCFSHFILTATALGMLKPEELEPMQLLVDLWAANGTFPAGSKAHSYASLKSGASLLQLGMPAKDDA